VNPFSSIPDPIAEFVREMREYHGQDAGDAITSIWLGHMNTLRDLSKRIPGIFSAILANKKRFWEICDAYVTAPETQRQYEKAAGRRDYETASSLFQERAVSFVDRCRVMRGLPAKNRLSVPLEFFCASGNASLVSELREQGAVFRPEL
jgi:hypothetical protein